MAKVGKTVKKNLGHRHRHQHGHRRFFKKKSLIYLQIKDTRRNTKGFIKFSRFLRPLKARFQIVNESNPRLYNSLKVRHNNILFCYTLRSRKRQEIYAYESFMYTLEDISGEATKFWEYNCRGEITSMTNFFKSLCINMLDVAAFLNTKNISHQNMGSTENIVFCEDDIPKIYNFSHSSTGGLRGLCKDLQGIVSLIKSVMKKCNVKDDYIPLELKSFMNLLSAYERNIGVEILKKHPALLNPEQGRTSMLEARDHLKLDKKNYRKWEWVLTARQVSPVLSPWQKVARTEPCLEKRVNERYTEQPGSLVEFVRDCYAHINDGQKVVAHTDAKLEQIFKRLFPNLFIEWFFYIHNIKPALNMY